VEKMVRLKRLQYVVAGRFRKPATRLKRLMEVVPISLLIFLLLFIMFGDWKDAGLVFSMCLLP
jgi:cobalt-zinc-cadmium resistance protein CzcA